MGPVTGGMDLSGSKGLDEGPPHGGKRAGAGRKLKWSFDDVLAVGQMCEGRWREAEAAAVIKSKAVKFSEQSDITSLHNSASSVPKAERSAWRMSEEGETHNADMEVEIEFLNEAILGVPSQNRVFSVLNRPPRGTRKAILEEAAAKFCITVQQVDNLWQAYRRFERK